MVILPHQPKFFGRCPPNPGTSCQSSLPAIASALGQPELGMYHKEKEQAKHQTSAQHGQTLQFRRQQPCAGSSFPDDKALFGGAFGSQNEVPLLCAKPCNAQVQVSTLYEQQQDQSNDQPGCLIEHPLQDEIPAEKTHCNRSALAAILSVSAQCPIPTHIAPHGKITRWAKN